MFGPDPLAPLHCFPLSARKLLAAPPRACAMLGSHVDWVKQDSEVHLARPPLGCGIGELHEARGPLGVLKSALFNPTPAWRWQSHTVGTRAPTKTLHWTCVNMCIQE